ncbi:hypothetical protein GCM10009117_14120 [Gangjinia marincola]|uniref:Lipoprotein n=1 Tax=Gangjinia marincola TaxID=578463 RepID=A0ABP3XV40_9FLAO
MNKYMLLGVLVFTLVSCDSKTKEEVKNEVDNLFSFENKIPVQNDWLLLKKSYEDKNEDQFMKQFPSSFITFMDYFGWNEIENNPNPLYDVSIDYINYWFSNLSKKEHKKYEDKLIGIAMNGSWQADAVNYFQYNMIEYLKRENAFTLINKINEEDAKSVLFFLFDGPHPKRDNSFEKGLNSEKKELLDNIFDQNFLNNTIHTNQTIETVYELSYYKKSDSYFSKDIDVNKDGNPDIVISNKRLEGNELLFFDSKVNPSKLILKSINFSEDGGYTIDTIEPLDKDGVLKIITYSAGGDTFAEHYIDFINNRWMLTKTIYINEVSTEKETTIYRCVIQQNLEMSELSNTEYAKKIKQLPAQDIRKEKCEVSVREN